MTPDTDQRKRRSLASFALLVVLVAIAGGAVWWLERSGPADPPEPTLTQEAKDYTSNLALANVEMKATDNALGQTLVEIEGDISNRGDRTLRRVVLTCQFFDINGIEIMREPLPIVRERDGKFAPGETRRFRLPFDAIPDGWNQAMPRLMIAEIVFE
jgi:hypothetical protein